MKTDPPIVIRNQVPPAWTYLEAPSVFSLSQSKPPVSHRSAMSPSSDNSNVNAIIHSTEESKVLNTSPHDGSGCFRTATQGCLNWSI